MIGFMDVYKHYMHEMYVSAVAGTELAERVCVMGISMNLVTYLVEELHLSTSRSANIVTNFMGTLNLLALRSPGLSG